MIQSLWGEEFNIDESAQNNKKLLNKIKTPKIVDSKKAISSKKVPVKDKLEIIKTNVYNILGHYKEDTLVIRTKEELTSYIDKSLENGIIAIDTETNNSLDPLTCKLMGPCIYTPGLKQAYIPLNHVDVDSGERLSWQLTEKDIAEEFERVKSIKILMHNGKFDYKVIKCTCGVVLPIYWDTMIAARLIDENEPSAGLKQQYIDKINPEQTKYDIEHLFEGIEYALVDPELFALYAATDAKMTYDLYKWQEKRFQDPDLEGSYWVFRNIESPLIEVVAEMELVGVEIDDGYASRLSSKYHIKSNSLTKRISNVIENLKPTINAWRLTPEANKKELTGNAKNPKSKNEKLADPVDVGSPQQLAILLYDILKMPVVDTKKPRSTGEEQLKSLAEKTHHPLCELILEKRTLDKLLNTFIDSLPKNRSPKDNKIHCQFNQMGTDTGRFSSSEPNLQQIPRSNLEIKPMFKAPKGYSWVCCDLSAAEVRMGANASNDESMLNAYKEGQDLYALVASKIYKNNYEDNLEFYPEGTKIMFEGKEVICGHKTHLNKSGKLRRQDSKSVLIGLLYGRGAASIASQISEVRIQKGEPPVTKEDAQQLINNIYESFPRLKQWMDETHNFLHKNGYIDDVFGRRRRLPNGMRERYVFNASPSFVNSNFNPILGCNSGISETTINRYKKLLENSKGYKETEEIKKQALNEGIEIHDYNGYIAEAERQSVNFQCQAPSSSVNKLSMIAISRDKRLKELGFQLLMTIHDEVIGQCPSENAKEVAEILPQIMVSVGKDRIKCPLVADSTIIKHWYEDDLTTYINESYNNRIKAGEEPETAINEIIEDHTELMPEQIRGVLTGTMNGLWGGLQ